MHPDHVPAAPVAPQPGTGPIALRPRRRVVRMGALAGLVAVVFSAGLVVGQVRPADQGIAAGADLSPTASHQPGGPGSVVPDGAPEDFGVFWEALKVVQDRFVDPSKLSDENLTWGAIRGMVDALGDTGHTTFLTPDEVQAQSEQLSGRISGIGIMVDTRAGTPLIISVFDGSPADKAGLRAGDLITSVDGQPTQRLTVDEVIKLVRGPAGTPATLGILHRDGTSEEVPIVRAQIEVPQASWAFVPGTKVADIRLSQFSQGAGDAVRASLTEAIAKGATSVVLDLRGNPGGLVDEAVDIAGMFLPQGATVYGQQDRSGLEPPVTTTDTPIAPDLPVVVLVDYGSASSSEILAAALQDSGRAQVLGQKTFGTGTVLSLIPLADGSAVLLGVIEWLTPKGEGIFDVGITPDVVVALPADGAVTEPSELQDQTRKEFRESTDTQLRRAVRALTTTVPPATPIPEVSPAP
ncbi:MAG: S41 family peptidase [Chloroflexi bacterium]|nr:S41 family peptidase [Chloroflexota bacterium]